MDLAAALKSEWLLTDGAGGYACSTATGCPTRRYHGLLTAVSPEHGTRHVFLNCYSETLVTENGRHELSAVCRADTDATDGPWGLEGAVGWQAFELAPWPRFAHTVGGIELEREVLLSRAGPPTALVRYRLSADSPATRLELRPYLSFRAADALTVANEVLNTTVTVEGNRTFTCQPYEVFPALAFTHDAAAEPFATEPHWQRGVLYPLDRERGYDAIEDRFSPGVLAVQLEPGATFTITARLGSEPVTDIALLWKEAAQAQGRAANADWIDVLRRSADDFFYRTPAGKREREGVLAGFPWFGEWGRDTFIALPGLTLGSGAERASRCAAILEGALPHLRKGLLPNIFGDASNPSHYGSADAALWFVRALRAYENAHGLGAEHRKDFRTALESIAEHYLAGTDLGLRVDARGLLEAGNEDVNATWMDAQTPAGPVTPRNGCAVELNALWYFLLAYLEQMCRDAGDERAALKWKKQRTATGSAFLEAFWLPDERRLADLVRGEVADASIRPNMVIAAALELSPLSQSQRWDVVQCARTALLTPRGLRTLAPDDPQYRGRYSGGPDERDGAYHQGTVWPWPLGFYCEAYMRARQPLLHAEREELRALLRGFEDHLAEAGLGHVSEVFDGDAPHRPGGCFAQAWSESEILRAWTMLGERDT